MCAVQWAQPCQGPQSLAPAPGPHPRGNGSGFPSGLCVDVDGDVENVHSRFLPLNSLQFKLAPTEASYTCVVYPAVYPRPRLLAQLCNNPVNKQDELHGCCGFSISKLRPPDSSSCVCPCVCLFFIPSLSPSGAWSIPPTSVS